MVQLTVESLTRSYGDKVLFEEITFGVEEGDKCGLIAPNGSGKTTLLKTLAGAEEPENGSVTWNKSVRLAWLPQEPNLHPEDTVMEALFKQAGKSGAALKNYYNLHSDIPENDLQYQKAIEQMQEENAWELDVLARKIISNLQLPGLETPCGKLSGGQKKRVALGAVLLLQPDFLLLDEPTNHLDLPMNEWLEEYLKSSNLSLLMVTHDRYFLERVCNRILEIEGTQLYLYEGNYQYFLEKRAERKNAEAVRAEKAERLLKDELKWLGRQPKARGTKSKARIERAENLMKEVSSNQEEERDLQLASHMQRLGKQVLELKNISKQYDAQVIINDFSYYFKKGEKLGVTGKNGTGKTTFFKIMNGDIQPDQGEVVRGETLKIGYYRQEGLDLDENKKVIDVVREIAEEIKLGENQAVSPEQFLERFLFDRKQQHQKVSTLSGGEKKRLYLVTILIQGPNFLMLDEPTNDLDLLTINRLEDFLAQFKGCAVVITHDRYFLDKMIDHLFVFRGEGEIKDFPGNYTQYRQEIRQAEKKQASQPKEEHKKKQKPQKSGSGKKLSYKEKLELENLEKEIEEMEEEKSRLEEKLQANPPEGEEMMNLSDRLSELVQKIEEKTERWFELQEKQENT